MNNVQYELVFDDPLFVEESLIIIRNELFKITQEKLDNDLDNVTLQKCVEYRKKQLEEIHNGRL